MSKDSMRAAFLGSAMTLAAVAFGALAFRSPPVEAQTSAGYRECFFGIQEFVDINDEGVVQTPQRNRLIRVPTGWEVVSSGGMGSDNHERGGVVMFCRR